MDAVSFLIDWKFARSSTLCRLHVLAVQWRLGERLPRTQQHRSDGRLPVQIFTTPAGGTRQRSPSPSCGSPFFLRPVPVVARGRACPAGRCSCDRSAGAPFRAVTAGAATSPPAKSDHSGAGQCHPQAHRFASAPAWWSAVSTHVIAFGGWSASVWCRRRLRVSSWPLPQGRSAATMRGSHLDRGLRRPCRRRRRPGLSAAGTAHAANFCRGAARKGRRPRRRSRQMVARAA